LLFKFSITYAFRLDAESDIHFLCLFCKTMFRVSWKQSHKLCVLSGDKTESKLSYKYAYANAFLLRYRRWNLANFYASDNAANKIDDSLVIGSPLNT